MTNKVKLLLVLSAVALTSMGGYTVYNTISTIVSFHGHLNINIQQEETK